MQTINKFDEVFTVGNNYYYVENLKTIIKSKCVAIQGRDLLFENGVAKNVDNVFNEKSKKLIEISIKNKKNKKYKK
jgi:hypothetical protein